MQRFFSLLLALVLFSPAVYAQDFSGTYSGTNNGTAIALTLRQEGSALRGETQASGQRFQLSAQAHGTTAAGTLTDPQTGGAMTVELSLQGDALTLVLFVPHEYTGQLQRVPLMLQRSAPSRRNQPASTGRTGNRAAGERDPRLVGLWSRQDVMTGGGMSVATQYFMVFRADGTGAQGDARSVGGGADWHGDTGHSGESQAFLWRTEGDVIYGSVPGIDQWAPVGRYYIQEGKLLLTYTDGSREVWYRE